MQPYLDFMRHVRDHGNRKDDRTGTGTLSVFGYQMRFDLAQGFPLLTTKKVHTRSIIHELLWFLAGDTNTAYLKANGVSIWDEWADGKVVLRRRQRRPPARGRLRLPAARARPVGPSKRTAVTSAKKLGPSRRTTASWLSRRWQTKAAATRSIADQTRGSLTRASVLRCRRWTIRQALRSVMRGFSLMKLGRDATRVAIPPLRYQLGVSITQPLQLIQNFPVRHEAVTLRKAARTLRPRPNQLVRPSYRSPECGARSELAGEPTRPDQYARHRGADTSRTDKPRPCAPPRGMQRSCRRRSRHSWHLSLLPCLPCFLACLASLLALLPCFLASLLPYFSFFGT